jgi:REP element-mobilizing transposase RayT
MVGILRNLECSDVTAGGVADHVHVVCNLTKKHAPMKVLEILKKDSSKWVKTQSSNMASFHWQDGYGLFSLSASHVPAAKAYVLGQEAHHQKESFKEEFLRLLKRSGMAYDERYLWD